MKAKVRDNCRQQSRLLFKRDKRECRRAELVRYLCAIYWTMLISSANCCQDMLDIFNKVLHTGLDLLMPVRGVRVNTSDTPWMNDLLKSLILKRQKAFYDSGTESKLYRFYRNAVNRERKSCKASFYKSNVEHMEENPKVWWKEVKRLRGFNPNPGNVSSRIHIEGIENLSERDPENAIKEAFIEPLEEYCLPHPLTKLRIGKDTPEPPEVSKMRIFKLLVALNSSKACGPDEIPNWMLKEYADLLSFPISRIINLSLKEQSLPKIWKFAVVSPLPKVKPVEDQKKQFRPISLTPCLSKVAEECVVLDYAKPAVLDVLDPSQHGAVPNSFTTQALRHKLHNWSK